MAEDSFSRDVQDWFKLPLLDHPQVRVLTGDVGEHITKSAKNAHDLVQRIIGKGLMAAAEYGHVVPYRYYRFVFEFNGAEVEILATDTPNSLVDRIEKQMEENHQKYLHSEESQAEQRRHEQRVAALQKQVDDLMGTLEETVTKSSTDVLRWLYYWCQGHDYTDVKTEPEKVKAVLESAGYRVNENVGVQGMTSEQEVRYIIGQGMSFLSYGSVGMPPIFFYHAEQLLSSLGAK